MIQDFKVKSLFEDQFHERHQFTLNIDGGNYQGIYHDGEIQWFHPQPKLEEEEFEDLEFEVYDLMTNHLDNQDFKVKPLFEAQFHERHQFTLNIEGDNYQGIFHNGKIQWFHPQPEIKLEEDDLRDLESKVYDLMTNDAYPDLEVKPLFEDQFHERHQFTLNIEGDNYQGIFHGGEIQWFHPQPNTKLEEDDLRDLESKVYDLMTNDAYPDLEVKPLFEDQFHERHQFTLNIEGDNYQGIFHGGEIQWFHPQPNIKLEENDLQDLESKVHDMMTNHLEQ